MTLQIEELPFEVSPEAVTAFCRKWKVQELALFGSVLREDFRPDSDVDVLVTFEPDAPWSLWDWAAMMDELKSIFGRNVDLIEKDAVRNPFRRRAMLREHRVIYAA
ncbi:MAG: nucleotidyltransferase family protein [Candidatus Hydrogenedentota bacterium]